MSLWVFSLCMDWVMKELKMGIDRMGVKFSGEGTESRLVDLVYLGGNELREELEENLRSCKIKKKKNNNNKDLKVNADEKEMMVVRGKEGWVCEVSVALGIYLT